MLIISCFNISLHKIMCLGGDDPRIADLKKGEMQKRIGSTPYNGDLFNANGVANANETAPIIAILSHLMLK